MSFFGGVKKIIKPFVDVPKWIGYRQLVKTNRSLYSFAKKFFIPEQANTQESFQVALDRLKLSEADLCRRMKAFTRLMWIWILLFLISIAYSIHLLFENSLRGFFPCLGVTVIILTQIFRYHFWIFQIKQRRLGCGFRDWLTAQLTMGKKK
ncbi:MAG: type IVB secretion system protein IcmV [Pseudomonadota bacterium]